MVYWSCCWYLVACSLVGRRTPPRVTRCRCSPVRDSCPSYLSRCRSRSCTHSGTTPDPNTAWSTLWIEEQTGIDLDLLKGSAEKTALLFASGSDLPDIMSWMKIGLEEQALYGAQGLIQPLNDYIDEYGFWYNKAIEYNPAIKADMVMSDGNIYAIAQFGECYHCTLGQKMWINRAWLDSLGLDTPRTTEEFYQVLKAFKERDPNGNGVADEIPLAGAIKGWWTKVDGFLISAFTYTDIGDRLRLDNNRVEAAYTDPEFREGLRYLHKLTSEGLVNPDSFVQEMSYLKQLTMGEYNRVGAIPTSAPTAFADQGSEAYKQFEILLPLIGPKGVQQTQYSARGVLPERSAVITQNAEFPEAAFRLLDYAYSQNWYLHVGFGEPGRDWRYARPDEAGLTGEPGSAVYEEIIYFKESMQANRALDNLLPTFIPASLFNGRVADPVNDPYYIELVIAEASKQYEPFVPTSGPTFIGKYRVATEHATDYSQLRASLRQHVDEAIAAFATGTRDIHSDAEWDKFQQELVQIGLPRYLEIIQAAWDDKLSRLGQ